ncbi:MAG: hypothetical protein AB7S38_33310 [Vulcanimicrobiota bacterium]
MVIHNAAAQRPTFQIPGTPPRQEKEAQPQPPADSFTPSPTPKAPLPWKRAMLNGAVASVLIGGGIAAALRSPTAGLIAAAVGGAAGVALAFYDANKEA